jgi:8-oxo-dGTP diphosphatase
MRRKLSLNADHAMTSEGVLRDIRTGAHRPDVLLLAAAVVVHDDRVLIVRRSKTERFLPCVWGVPCGKVDPDEEARDAAVRELREETGLSGTVVRRLGQSVFSSLWRGQTVRNLPKADQEAAWLRRDDCGKRLIFLVRHLRPTRAQRLLYSAATDSNPMR